MWYSLDEDIGNYSNNSIDGDDSMDLECDKDEGQENDIPIEVSI